MTANDKTLQNGGSDKSTLATPANVKENIGIGVAEPLPHNADLGHFRAGVAMRSSFRSQRDNTRAQ